MFDGARGRQHTAVVWNRRVTLLVSAAFLVTACSSGSHRATSRSLVGTTTRAGAAPTTRGSTPTTARRYTTTPTGPNTSTTTGPKTSTTLVSTPWDGQVVQPPTFPFPTFIKTTGRNRISIARLDNSQIVYTIVPSQTSGRTPVFQSAARAPNGDLLIYSFGGISLSSWRDVRTGVTFPGYADAKVSPDGSRIARSGSCDQGPCLFEYDFATGRLLHRIPINPGSKYATLSGFSWTPDSRSLVVSISPFAITQGPKKGSTDWGGVWMVDRDAPALPAHRILAVSPGAEVYSQPTMLTNGHMLVDRFRYPDQHDAWPSTIFDVDLSTGTQRKVADVPIELGPSIDARGNEALISADSTIWLHDGENHTLRVVAHRAFVGHW